MNIATVGPAVEVNPYRGYNDPQLADTLMWWQAIERKAINAEQRARALRGIRLALEEIERRKVKP